MELKSPEMQMFMLAAAAYVLVAGVSTMPPKDAQWTWRTLYGWLYDFTHILVNVAVSRRPSLAAAESPKPLSTEDK